MLELNLNPRAFAAINAGTKIVEVRANKGDGKFNDSLVGNYIAFKDITSGESIICLVKYIRLYNSTEELLTREGLKNTLSSYDNSFPPDNSTISFEIDLSSRKDNSRTEYYKNLVNGICSIESIISEYEGRTTNYGEIIRMNGVFAIGVEKCNSLDYTELSIKI